MKRPSTLSPWADGEDPAPDFYTVDRIEGGFKVEHFPYAKASKPCCRLTVRITEADRRDPQGGEIAALARSQRVVDEHHARKSAA